MDLTKPLQENDTIESSESLPDDTESFRTFLVRYTYDSKADCYFFRLRDPSPETGCSWVKAEANPRDQHYDPSIFPFLLNAFQAGGSVDLTLLTPKTSRKNRPWGPREDELVAELVAISLEFNY